MRSWRGYSRRILGALLLMLVGRRGRRRRARALRVGGYGRRPRGGCGALLVWLLLLLLLSLLGRRRCAMSRGLLRLRLRGCLVRRRTHFVLHLRVLDAVLGRAVGCLAVR